MEPHVSFLTKLPTDRYDKDAFKCGHNIAYSCRHDVG
jgi:hypothetical protein